MVRTEPLQKVLSDRDIESSANPPKSLITGYGDHCAEIRPEHKSKLRQKNKKGFKGNIKQKLKQVCLIWQQLQKAGESGQIKAFPLQINQQVCPRKKVVCHLISAEGFRISLKHPITWLNQQRNQRRCQHLLKMRIFAKSDSRRHKNP